MSKLDILHIIFFLRVINNRQIINGNLNIVGIFKYCFLMPVVIDTPWDGYSESVEVTGNMFYTTGEAHIYKGTWAGDGLGNWKYKGPMNYETVQFKNNAYSRVVDHEEDGMQSLKHDETLQSLIDRLSDDSKTGDGFDKLLTFLRQSKQWSVIEKSL